MLIECAWCAVRQKDTYLRVKFYQLTSRMGPKKALVAIAHKMLVAIWHIFKNKISYKDLGADYLNAGRKDKIARHYIKKLQQLGFELQLPTIDK
jgi:transposase